jgi:endonuclease YncB( thermonuclease family)
MSHLLRPLLLALALVGLACGPPEGARYSRKQAQESLGQLETPGVVLGEFRLTKVVDGDTVRVDGLDSALRLLAIDTEETFKSDKERREYENGWEAYIRAARARSRRPGRAATPMGEEAHQWAKDFFAGTTRVRLERDDPREIRDRFNRYLAYVLVERDGVWVNYNVECVRAGMSPYFTKYGYSRRYHQAFVDAEREARAARRGIWDPSKQRYPDYDERKAWWLARAEFLAEFDRLAKGRDDHVVLTHFDSMKRIEQAEGQEVTVLGTVGEVRRGDRGPTRVLLSRRMFGDFPIVFFDKDVFASTGLAAWRGEFVTVRGIVSVYENKRSGRKTLQIVVDRPGQVTLSRIPGLERPGERRRPGRDAAAAETARSAHAN